MTLSAQLRGLAHNRTAVLGSAAGLVLVYLAWRQLRVAQTPPQVIVSSPADTGATDLSAYQAGAAAASSGFDAGMALGQSALGLAGSVVSDLGGVASTLAQSQADMGNTLGSTILGILSNPTQSPSPAPSPAPPPGSTPTPPPPAPTLYTVSSTGSTEYASASLSARVVGTLRGSASATRSLVNGVWWYRLTTVNPGAWVHADGRLTAKAA